jgi:hypothetical protein
MRELTLKYKLLCHDAPRSAYAISHWTRRDREWI